MAATVDAMIIFSKHNLHYRNIIKIFNRRKWPNIQFRLYRLDASTHLKKNTELCNFIWLVWIFYDKHNLVLMHF